VKRKGKLYGVGLGPGDPELITLKGLKAIEHADVIAYHQAKGKSSHALQIAQNYIRADQIKCPLIYPLTRELPPDSQDYQRIMDAFYDQITAQIADFLNRGLVVSILVAGDPLLYSSFLPIYQSLGKAYETVIIPGVISATAAAAVAGFPLCRGDETLTILSGLLPEDELYARLCDPGAFAILKLGNGHFDKVRRCLRAAGRNSRALYIERATQLQQKIMPLDEVEAKKVPYFSLILVGA